MAFDLHCRIGTRWRYPAMGGVALGYQWEAVYPIMDRVARDAAEWNDLHDALQHLEGAALEAMQKYAPKGK